MKNLQSGDLAWLAIICYGLAYEFTHDDLLSFATERWCRKHPILARALILALAGHLACVLPAAIDVFDAKNVAHRGVAAGIRWGKQQRRVEWPSSFSVNKRLLSATYTRTKTTLIAVR